MPGWGKSGSPLINDWAPPGDSALRVAANIREKIVGPRQVHTILVSPESRSRSGRVAASRSQPAACAQQVSTGFG